MKFILLAALVALLWLWRSSRHGAVTERRPPAPPRLQLMVRCAACGTHLPSSDALPGAGGRYYCCAEHKRRGER